MKNIARALLACLALVAMAPAVQAGSFGAEKNITGNASLGAGFPEIAYYNGVIHVVFVGYASGKQGDIFYTRSTVASGTFSAPVNLTNNATAATGNDHPYVTAGPNGVYVAWNSDNNTGAIYYARSTDGGLNFGAATLVAGVANDAYYSRMSDLMTDSAGNVHVAYFTNADTAGVAGDIHHRMICSGTTLSADTAVSSVAADGQVDNEEPRIAESGGKLYLTFRSSRNGNPQGGWPPYSIQLQTGTVSGCGATWNYPARRVGGGIPLSLASSYRPDVFTDGGGNTHLAWWDLKHGANVVYRKGNLATGVLGAQQQVSTFNTDHLEPGGVSSSAAVTYGGIQAPPGLATNGTSAFLAYSRNANVAAVNFEYGPVYLRESPDNGVTWGPEQPVAGTNQGAAPRVAFDNATPTNLGVVWLDVRSGGAQVYYRLYSTVSTGPSFSLTPDPTTFGSTAVGTNSGNQVVTLLNSGLAGTISGAVTTGDFTIVGQTCGASLGSGASCTYTVRFNPTALGSRTGTLQVTNNSLGSPNTAQLTGTGTAGTYNANIGAVITGFYETILGRSPDAGGYNFWVSEAARVTNLGVDVREVFFAMSVQFFNSPEYLGRATSDTQYLTDLYNTFFLRAPDGPGLAYWQSQLNGGMDRGAMLNNFLFSTEFSNQMTSLFGSPVVRPEINLTIDLYRGILGVLPDDAGFNYWLGQIRAAQCQGGPAVTAQVDSLAAAFISSPQYGNREAARPVNLRQNMHVGDLYNAFLRRGGDLNGYNYWVGQLTSAAQTRTQVRTAFVQSPEFQGRVNAVIAAGCFP